jgi:ribosomal protein L35AE/L33A
MNHGRPLVLAAIFWIAAACSAQAAERKHMVGFGLDTAIVDAESLPDSLDFTGFSVFGKVGLTKNWGILLSYRDMEDDENLAFGETDTYTQIGAYGVYMWRPDKVVRPHVKFGVSRIDFEAELPGLTMGDDDIAFAFGGGLEAGSQQVAFFGDYDFTTVTLLGSDIDFGDLTLGVVFRF